VVGQRLLRGDPGSAVKLMLLRSGENDPITVSLDRERLQAQHARSRVLEPGVGYVKVPEFEPRTAEEVKGELETLRRAGAHTLVLDLRGNGFGSVPDGVRLAELFLKGGVVAKLTGARAAEEVFTADAQRTAWTGPLAVLIDTGTAGAAEVVAAAILDAERAPVVGIRSFGRTPQQKTVPLPEGGLVITVARYVSPKGTAIHTRGVEPSVRVDLPDEDEMAEGAAPDRILEKALETLKGGAVKKAA
jgi:carboxyl-terminal processing protease